jgi:hypothetical protein
MTKTADQLITQAQLTRQMSEVISLREKVAQAELAAQCYGITAVQHAVVAKLVAQDR